METAIKFVWFGHLLMITRWLTDLRHNYLRRNEWALLVLIRVYLLLLMLCFILCQALIQCFAFSEAKGFCNWKKARNYRLVLADQVPENASTAEDCESECLKQGQFTCRSFTFDTNSRRCFLSHHNRKSAPNSSFFPNPSTLFYEIASCFEGNSFLRTFQDCFSLLSRRGRLVFKSFQQS